MKLRFRLKSVFVASLLFALALAWYVSNRSALSLESRILADLRGNRSGFNTIWVIHSHSDPDFVVGPNAIGQALKEPTSFMNKIGAAYDANLFERIHKLVVLPNQLDDGSLELIAKLPSLKRLTIEDGDFTRIAIDEFRQARPDVLIELD